MFLGAGLVLSGCGEDDTATTPAVAAWIAGHDAQEMCLTTVTEAELRYFREWILSFDSAAARTYAEIAADRRQAGRPIGEADRQIAAICRSRGAILITRDVRDFNGAGIAVADPWTATGD